MTNQEIEVLKDLVNALCLNTGNVMYVREVLIKELNSLKQPEEKISLEKLKAVYHPFPVPVDELIKHGHLNPGGTD